MLVGSGVIGFGEKAFLGHGRTATIEAAHEEVLLLVVVGDNLDKGVLERLVAGVLPDNEVSVDGLSNTARDRWRNSAAKFSNIVNLMYLPHVASHLSEASPFIFVHQRWKQHVRN